MQLRHGDHVINLDAVLASAPDKVEVWSVPTDYREEGYFVSAGYPGVPGEIPACAAHEAQTLLRLLLSEDAPRVVYRHREATLEGDMEALAASLAIIRRKRELLARLALKRWDVETGGLVVGGVEVQTDRTSQERLSTAHAALAEGFQSAIDWKGVDGVWRQLDATVAAALLRAVVGHVQGCFSNERLKQEEIEAADTLEALTSVDLNEGWPPREVAIPTT